jgi:ABC-2 type transport system ATP-binding protein
MSDDAPTADDGLVHLQVRGRTGTIVEAVRRLDEAGVDVDDLGLRRPTMDDVFLSLTGRAPVSETDDEADKAEAAA